MDFKDRLDLYLEGGMIDQNDVNDINAIINMFQEKYGVTLCEENASTFIAHIAAAYSRLKTQEPVEELPECVMSELTGLDTYQKSLEVLNSLIEVTHNPLEQVERDYALLHINNLIATFKQQGCWKD